MVLLFLFMFWYFYAYPTLAIRIKIKPGGRSERLFACGEQTFWIISWLTGSPRAAAASGLAGGRGMSSLGYRFVRRVLLIKGMMAVLFCGQSVFFFLFFSFQDE